MLPGTSRASDRFVRASFYINTLPKKLDLKMATAGVFAVIRNASAPFGAADPKTPNISATLWRTLADQTNKIYYYESTTSPDVFWITLNDLDFAGGVQKLKVSDGEVYAGNAAKQFKLAVPFNFLEAEQIKP